MKKITSFSWVNALVGVTLCAILFAFSPVPGAHSVQVYLDSKLVLDQYVNFKSDAPKLTLDPAEKYSQLIVKYSECGRTVTGRALTLKDDHNKVLKDWRYDGASTGYSESMSCSVKDIIALKQKGSNMLKLYYSSKEFPEGHQIAYLVITGNAATASK
ncbi:MAG: hypothetical protein HY015_10075 [Bacteroidetes bacterium]|nr:hypothetical protein [Bacteroidota bacterium]MBI3483297.1 hypothetical protein [Bacteroidota bacterium]